MQTHLHRRREVSRQQGLSYQTLGVCNNTSQNTSHNTSAVSSACVIRPSASTTTRHTTQQVTLTVSSGEVQLLCLFVVSLVDVRLAGDQLKRVGAVLTGRLF